MSEIVMGEHDGGSAMDMENARSELKQQKEHDPAGCPRKGLGNAVYARDVSFSGMLHAKILTAPYAHAKIVPLDTSRAESLLGVRDILRLDDPAIEKMAGRAQIHPCFTASSHCRVQPTFSSVRWES